MGSRIERIKFFISKRGEEEQSLLLAIIVAVVVFAVLMIAVSKGGKGVAKMFLSFFQTLINFIKDKTKMDYIFR